MTDQTTPPVKPAPGLTSRFRRRATGPSWSVTLAIMFLLVAVVLGVGAWFQQKRFETTGREIATQLQTFSIQLSDSRRESRQALSLVESHSGRIAELELSLRESQSQYAALERAWDSFNNGLEDAMLANDMGRLITLASQQLRLAGNANNAIMALETALSTLVRADRPKFAALQRAINTDLDRLRAQPMVDIPTISVRLDSLISLVGRAPLMVPDRAAPQISKISPLPVSAGSGPDAAPGNAVLPALSTLDSAVAAPATLAITDLAWWREQWFQGVDGSKQLIKTFAAALARELSGVVSIQRVSDANALLMSSEQGAQLRANLRTRLLTAQMALLMHQPTVWRSELVAVETSLTQRFDPKSAEGVAALRLVRELAGVTVAISSQDIVDSLSALEAVRLAETSTHKNGN